MSENKNENVLNLMFTFLEVLSRLFISLSIVFILIDLGFIISTGIKLILSLWSALPLVNYFRTLKNDR